jgi:hypothetical protein
MSVATTQVPVPIQQDLAKAGATFDFPIQNPRSRQMTSHRKFHVWVPELRRSHGGIQTFSRL